ncbi:MAG: hypothetical protein N2749_07000 [Clostridia bacterium]|nr:hypothetical protein [Clostridia bacterium]
MDNAQKAIMIGVGLFITIIIIGAVMTITGLGQNLLNQGQSQLGGITSQIQQQLTAEYDDVQLTGAEVLAAIQKYYTDPKMVVQLYNKSGTYTQTDASVKFTSQNSVTVTAPTVNTAKVVATTAIGANSAQPSYNSFTTPGHAMYISISGQYQAQLIQNNGATIGIAFFRK